MEMEGERERALWMSSGGEKEVVTSVMMDGGCVVCGWTRPGEELGAKKKINVIQSRGGG